MVIEKVDLSDEELDKINEATYELNSVARQVIYIRLGLPVKNGKTINEKLSRVKELLKDITA